MNIIQEYYQTNNINRSPNLKKSNLAFVYVPKTGGTFLNIPIIPGYKRLGPKNSPRMVHMPCSKILNLTQDQNINLFTLVRDPYDLACSEYFFLKEKINYNLRYFNINAEKSVSSELASRFVAKLTGNPSYYEKLMKIYLENYSVSEYLEYIEKNPIYPYYYDVLTPKNFDCVGLTEEMDTTIKILYNMYEIEAGNGSFNKNKKKDVGKKYNFKYSRNNFLNKNKKDYEIYYEGIEKFNLLKDKNLG
jgi:hypothetical protein